MTNALDLEKLIAGDTQFRTQEERKIEINKRFVTLFPKPVKKGWFIFGKLEYQKLTRPQIKETLVRNHLVSEGTDPETATDEALKRNYDVEAYGDLYRFVEMIDGNNNKSYEFQLRRYLMADGI